MILKKKNHGMGKRPDRRQKLLERKHTSETVIKSTLRSILRDGVDKDSWIEAIRRRVVSCSRRIHLAGLAVNLLAFEAYENVEDVSQASVPCFWEDTFVRQLLLGTQGCSKAIPIIKDLHARHPELLHDPLDRQHGDGNIYTFAAKKFATNLKTHMTVDTPRMIKRLIYAALPDTDQAVLALFRIYNWEVPQDREFPVPSSDTLELIACCRNVLGLQDGEGIGKKWFTLAGSMRRMLHFRVFALRHLKNIKFKKSYQILPITRIKSHFITIDAMGLWGICRELNLVKGDCNVFQSISKHHWESLFHVHKNAGRSKKFSGTMDTDGIAANLHYLRPKSHKEQEEVEANSGEKLKPKKIPTYKPDPLKDRVIGNDPGRTNIFYMAEELEDGTVRKYRLTRSHYYQQSGATLAIQRSNRWNLEVKEELQKLASNSPKVTKLSDYLKYLDIVMETKEALWNEYLKPRWSKQRLRVYGGKQRVFANFLNHIEDDGKAQGKRTVIAFGSAKFAPGGKGEISVPTSRAFKECSNRFQTISVDEFRTSRVCYEDETILLEGVGEWKDYQVKKVRGLLWCKTTNEYGGKLINRDLNAALNIRKCLLSGRPKALTRSKVVGVLPPLRTVKILRGKEKKKTSGQGTVPPDPQPSGTVERA